MPTPIRILVIEDDVMVAFAVIGDLERRGMDRRRPNRQAASSNRGVGSSSRWLGIMGSFHSASVRSEVR